MIVQKIVIIAGSTASGKSSFALKLADLFNTEIISADSLLVYKYMDIGTAKPLLEERKKIKHHLIDIVEPDISYSIDDFLNNCNETIYNLNTLNKKFIIAGGTGFYIKALLNGTYNTPESIPEVKNNLYNRLNNGESLSDLYNELKIIDPETALKISVNDQYRIIRALEVFKISGKKMSDFKKEHAVRAKNFEPLFIVLNLEKQELLKRIKARTQNMFDNGFIDEVQKILKMGYSPELKPLKSIGYKQVIEYLQNKISFEDAKISIYRETAALAKRQVTWFKKQAGTKWYHPDKDEKIIYEDVRKIINIE